MAPDERGGGPTPETASHHQLRRSRIRNQHPQSKHQGAYGCAWRRGFGAGFRDALRLAARELDDPAAWLVLARLADDYELAGDG